MLDKERTFLSSVKEAITLNPFSKERQAVDLSLSSMSPDSSPNEIIQKLVVELEKIIAPVTDREGRLAGGLSDSDRDLASYGYLFKSFYRYCECYDQLIEDQVAEGETSCKVLFADHFLHDLKTFGFKAVDAVRYFSLFYQMRRAFYFINKISGNSQCVQQLRMNLWNNIFTDNIELYDTYLWNRMEDFSTMLLGETGTGKGLAASAIGRSAFIPFDEKNSCFKESFAKTFISINLSQFPESLIESELFGHKKGAFTGAVENHQGVFSKCSSYGAIFIDEIGDVSIPVQIKLLQVLQERIFTPVGSHKSERFEGRVIAATNRPIAEMRVKGKFRDDFYYRICSDVIEIPPLRLRISQDPDELDTILGFIVERTVGEASASIVAGISTYIRKHQPKGYSWPGNIRELEQCVRQLLLRKAYRWTEREGETGLDLNRAFAEGRFTAQELLHRYCRNLYQQLGAYEAVGRVTGLDRRTVKKYIES